MSIETVRQQQLPSSADEPAAGRQAALVIVTHAAPDAALAATVEALADLDVVRRGGRCHARGG